jgi:hypothetical protein
MTGGIEIPKPTYPAKVAPTMI